MVMEKSWNMTNWPKVIEFCVSVMEFYQFCPQHCTKFCIFLVTTRKLSSDLESLHFLTSAKHPEFINGEMVMENQEMVMEYYFVKSVGIM